MFMGAPIFLFFWERRLVLFLFQQMHATSSLFNPSKIEYGWLISLIGHFYYYSSNTKGDDVRLSRVFVTRALQFIWYVNNRLFICMQPIRIFFAIIWTCQFNPRIIKQMHHFTIQSFPIILQFMVEKSIWL
jgi:hypothetical protein